MRWRATRTAVRSAGARRAGAGSCDDDRDRTPTRTSGEQVLACLALSLNFGPVDRTTRPRVRWNASARRTTATGSSRSPARVRSRSGSADARSRCAGSSASPRSPSTGAPVSRRGRSDSCCTRRARRRADLGAVPGDAPSVPPTRVRARGSFVTHAVRLDDLPAVSGPLAVEPYAPEDLDDVRDCYRRVASSNDGPIDSDDPMWWPDRIVGHWNPNETHRVAVARSEAGRVEGYLSYVHQPATGELEGSFDSRPSSSCGRTPRRSVRCSGTRAGIAGSPGPDVHRSPGGPALPGRGRAARDDRPDPAVDAPTARRTGRAPGARLPDVSGSTTLAIEDELFADNRGPGGSRPRTARSRSRVPRARRHPSCRSHALVALLGLRLGARRRAARRPLGPEDGVAFLAGCSRAGRRSCTTSTDLATRRPPPSPRARAAPRA